VRQFLAGQLVSLPIILRLLQRSVKFFDSALVGQPNLEDFLGVGGEVPNIRKRC
jgi:hypothetical protein